MRIILMLLAPCCLPVMALASPATVQGEEASQTQALVPPRLIRRLVPSYPAAARGQDLHGDVQVEVDVDAHGHVDNARVVSGEPVFHAAARATALSLRFQPAHRGGVPVPATTTVRLHFAPSAEALDDVDDVDDVDEELIVHSGDVDSDDTQSRQTFGEAELAHEAGGDLAGAIDGMAGVSSAKGTASVSKPIIRGQVERRLSVRVDGVRHASQKWGPDHAPEIEPFSAGSISVIRGAAGVRYGPDAVGGVLLVDPAPMRRAIGVGGRASIAGQLNGRRVFAGLRLDAGLPKHGLSLRAHGTYARGASLQAPDYVLGNTGSENWSAGGAAAWTGGTTELRLAYEHVQMRAGVFYGATAGTPEELEDGLAAEQPEGAEHWKVDYGIDRPSQRVGHDRLTAHAISDIGWGRFEAVYAFQHNHRQEYERARESVEGPQYDFVLRTHSLDAAVVHDSMRVGNARVALTGGVAGGFVENVYSGLSLIPNYRGLEAGLYVLGRMNWPRVSVSAGGRYDLRTQTAFMTEADHQAHLRRGTLDAEDCAFEDTVASCKRTFHAGTLTAGLVGRVVPDLFDLKLDLSSASRFPDADELYLNGSAPSFPIYAVGSPDLGVETTWGGSVTGVVQHPWLAAELSGFGSVVSNFVQFAPDRLEDGSPAVEVTVRGAFPRYVYKSVDAAFYGADGRLQVAPEFVLGLDLMGSLVRARPLEGGPVLVGTPADRFDVRVVVRAQHLGPISDAFIHVGLGGVDRQRHVDPSADLAPPPDGYLLLRASVGAVLHRPWGHLHMSLDASNLLNSAYRDYNSLMRYYADAPGRDVQLRATLEF